MSMHHLGRGATPGVSASTGTICHRLFAHFDRRLERDPAYSNIGPDA
jgi:hypothetical protein